MTDAQAHAVVGIAVFAFFAGMLVGSTWIVAWLPQPIEHDCPCMCGGNGR